MPSQAIIAAALTDHSAHSYSLWVDGLDMLYQPGQVKGSAYGAEIDSIQLSQGGPSANGTMSFILRDPSGNLQLQGAESVLFWDHVRDVPMFAGTVATLTEAIPDGIVHRFQVQCTDLNAVLDRILIPAMTLSDGSAQLQIQSIMQHVPLRAFQSLSTDAAAVALGGSQAKPMAYGNTQVSTALTGQVITDGTTARAAVQQIIDYWQAQVGYVLPGTLQVFVDQYGGLRLYDSFYAVVPSDYRQTTVRVASGVVTEPASVRPDNLQVTNDWLQAVTAVYVIGGNPAGTGWVAGVNASGYANPRALRKEARYSQPKSLDAVALQRYGLAYLTAYGAQARASFTMSARAPFTILPGDYIFISAPIWMQIQGYVQLVEQSFSGGGNLRAYRVEFGSLAASLARVMQ